MEFKINGKIYYVIWNNHKILACTIIAIYGDFIHFKIGNKHTVYKSDSINIFETQEDAEIELEKRILLQI